MSEECPRLPLRYGSLRCDLPSPHACNHYNKTRNQTWSTADAQSREEDDSA